MAFDEVQFPTSQDWGFTGGPKFKTTVFISKGGHEQRNEDWSTTRGEYRVGYGLEEPADWEALAVFFRARNGRSRGFRFKDWNDFRADMSETASNGIAFGKDDVTQNVQNSANVTFQLTKAYTSGSVTHVRTIAKPIITTIQFWLDTGGGPTEFTRVASSPAASEFSVASATGLITLNAANAPAVSDDLYWDGEFDVPVRFDTDQMDMEQEFFELVNWRGLPIVEIRDIS